MVKRQTYRSVTWVDVESPTEEEVESLVKEYKLHPLLGEELVERSVKPKVEVYKNCMYLVLHFPIRTQIKGKYFIVEKEVDFIVGRDFIITTKYDTVEPLHNFSKIFEVNSILDKSDFGDNAGIILYYMLKRLYKNLSSELEGVKDELGHAEAKIFADEEKDMVIRLSHIAKELIDFNQMLKRHGDILDIVLSANTEAFFESDFKYYIQDIRAYYSKILEKASNQKELLTDLRETNYSLLSTKQNETTKTLTIIAFIALPMSLIANIFTMNTVGTPIVGGPYDFEIIIGIMLFLTVAAISFSKYKKWI
ncbi:MAG: CorA family divalent cation transporter [Candidatus Taylorbacteria bacterium]|nr:CorA family divalent cation transporter [Candidatus Taylorbacteria bacterium]